MATNETLLGLGIIGAAVAIVLGYAAHVSVQVETYPDVEIAANGGVNAPLSKGTTEYLRPANSIGDVVYTPHRYPNVSGSNITALIHHGLDPLCKRAPSDSKWIEQPPAEVMWLPACQRATLNLNPVLVAGEIS
jgi:hypothetical protein